jgi:hypothetical protein
MQNGKEKLTTAAESSIKIYLKIYLNECLITFVFPFSQSKKEGTELVLVL